MHRDNNIWHKLSPILRMFSDMPNAFVDDILSRGVCNAAYMQQHSDDVRQAADGDDDKYN